jgi:hypothetical protein
MSKCKSPCATDSMIRIYSFMCENYEGKVNPLTDIRTMEQLACMRTEFSKMVYDELKAYCKHDQQYLLEILSKVNL